MSTTLKARLRSKVGSRHSRALRREGLIPANLQATREDPHVDLSIDEHEFLATRRHHQHLYDIEIDGRVETAIVRELQWDTFGQHITHVEFRRAVRGVEMESEVELVFEGMPKTGHLNHLVTHITIRSLPSLIPDNIEVVVTDMSAGDTIYAKDLRLPDGVSLGHDVEADLKVAVVRELREVVEKPEGEEGEEGPAPLAPAPPA